MTETAAFFLALIATIIISVLSVTGKATITAIQHDDSVPHHPEMFLVQDELAILGFALALVTLIAYIQYPEIACPATAKFGFWGEVLVIGGLILEFPLWACSAAGKGMQLKSGLEDVELPEKSKLGILIWFVNRNKWGFVSLFVILFVLLFGRL